MFLKDFLYICLSWPAALEHAQIEENRVNSGVFKGLGGEGNWTYCKKICFGLFWPVLWRQMCKLPCFEGKHCKHMQTHTGFGGFCGKNADNGAKCRLDSFSGRRHRGCLKFPSLGGPHAGEKIKKHPLGGSQGGEIVAMDGPGCVWLRSFLK